MANKYHHPYNDLQKQHIAFIDSLQNEEDYLKFKQNPKEFFKSRKKLLGLIAPRWKKIKKNNSTYRTAPLMDMNIITADVLIENIDYAFKVWEKAPWSSNYTFEEFCEYVLPYRTVHDIPGLWRKELSEEFSWVLDSMKDSDFLHAAKLINDHVKFGWEETLEEFSHMAISDLFAINRGVCRQHTSWKVAALRSIGIPVADASGPQSTSWAIVPDDNGKFYGWEAYTPPGEGARYIDDQRYMNYSKIYRSTYKIQPFPFSNTSQSDIPPQFFNLNRKDITQSQSDAADVPVELSIPAPNKTDYVFLCIFNRKSRTWQAVHWSNIRNKKGHFDQMGLGCVYLPMYYLNGQYSPAADPIYLNEKGLIINLKSKVNKKRHIEFTENLISTFGRIVMLI